MNISNKCLGVGLFIGLFLGVLGSAGEGSLVVEAVEVAAGLLELLDPFLGLYPHSKLPGTFSVRIRKAVPTSAIII